MKLKLKITDLIRMISVFALAAALILRPETGREGCIRGILLCGRVIIPSLFPFTVCVLYAVKCGLFEFLKPLNRILRILLGVNSTGLAVILLSCVGGYPVGAKLLSSYVSDGECDSEKGAIMLNCCINAGPAFIISAVGSGILGSRTAGIILFICHITASLILRVILRFIYGNFEIGGSGERRSVPHGDSFVISVSEAADTTLHVCFFVMFFSVISEYMSFYSEKIGALRLLCGALEVTNAVSQTKSIYIIAFLLGFGGLCVWCQIFSAAEALKINIFRFAVFRILHGLLSALLVRAVSAITGMAVPTLSNGAQFDGKLLYSNAALGAAMLIMGIIFIISATCEKYAGKILEDVI